MPTSKAKIYKPTSVGEIPHAKYGNKLVFSRRELFDWMQKQRIKAGEVVGRF